jgi:hypothetical protein
MKPAQMFFWGFRVFPVGGGTLFVLWLIILTLSSCQTDRGFQTLPETPGYIISGQNENLNFANNSMAIFNTKTMEQLTRIPLPRSKIEVLTQDALGNLWIGLSGGATWDDDRVVVLNPSGKQIAEIKACLYPTAGIQFYQQKAYVVCRDTGFVISVVKINLQSYQVEQKIELKLEDDRPFMAIASGLSNSKLIISALTSGPQEALAYTILTIVDVNSLKSIAQLELGAGTSIWTIISSNELVYLLNSEGVRNPKKQDILILDIKKQPQISKTVTLPVDSPLWGAVQNNTLYTYHNDTWNSTSSSPSRSICKTDLGNMQATCKKIPDNFDGNSLTVLNNQPCITHWGDAQTSGLYCLEDDGNLRLKFAFQDASLVLIPSSPNEKSK